METFFPVIALQPYPYGLLGSCLCFLAVFGGASARGVGVRKEVEEGKLGLYLMCIVGKAK